MPSTAGTVEVAFITPRHLAGGGDPAWITVPLHRASGWSHGDDPLMPRVLLSSPDQKALLRLEPDPAGPWWTLQHTAEAGRPAWYASFGARTPVELIAAFTDPVGPAAESHDPFGPLRHVAWSPPAIGADGLVSPDGTAYVQRLGSAEEPGSWFVTATLAPNRPPVWQARFGAHTPPHLVTAFTTALADPDPVYRTAGEQRLPTLNPHLVARKYVDVPAVHVAAALEDRVRSLATRPAGTPTTPIPARHSPPQRGHSR